ncbi:hypothetical protein PMI05_03059 [Brevibacillus sp. BC25]|nr:hypothetical protein PMI05_03059 [Brevibacillus sp. BC25]
MIALHLLTLNGIQKGNKYLKSSLTEAAHSVGASKNYLGALYRRTLARKGKQITEFNFHGKCIQGSKK